jgi:hypothetical protein
MGQMGRVQNKDGYTKLKPHSGTRLNRGLKLTFVLSLMLFFLVYNFSDKNDCDVCRFKFGSKVIGYTQAMDLYREGCLNNYYNKTAVYVPIDNITVNTSDTGLNSITFPNEAIKYTP